MKTFKLLTFLALSALCACSPRRETVYVPVEHTILRTDTVRQLSFRTDSVLDRDTIRFYQTGDTIRMEEIKWRYRIKERIDTIHSITQLRDTVTKVVEIPASISGGGAKRSKSSDSSKMAADGSEPSGFGAKMAAFKARVSALGAKTTATVSGFGAKIWTAITSPIITAIKWLCGIAILLALLYFLSRFLLSRLRNRKK